MRERPQLSSRLIVLPLMALIVGPLALVAAAVPSPPRLPAATAVGMGGGPVIGWTRLGDDVAGRVVAVDHHGNVIVAGHANRAGIATPGVVQTRFAGGPTDGTVTKYSPTGVLLWQTYLGGRGEDHINDIRVDAADRIVFAGGTDSPDFPMVHAWRGRTPPRAPAPNRYVPDAIVGVLNPDGGSLAFSTYMGAPAMDEAERVRVSPDGSLTVGGDESGYFFIDRSGIHTEMRQLQPTPGAYRAPFPTSFVVRISPDWRMRWIATPGTDHVVDDMLLSKLVGMDVDRVGNVYYAATVPADVALPVSGAWRKPNHGGLDMYAAALSRDGRRVLWGAFVGGSRDDRVADAVVTSNGFALYGTTVSRDFPRVHPVQRRCSLSSGPVTLADAAIALVSRDGKRLTWASCLGGTGAEDAARIAANTRGDLYVLGDTASPNFPVRRAWQPFAGDASDPAVSGDCFLAKITEAGVLAWSSPLGGHLGELGDTQYGGLAVGPQSVVATSVTTSPDMPGATAANEARTWPGAMFASSIEEATAGTGGGSPILGEPPTRHRRVSLG